MLFIYSYLYLAIERENMNINILESHADWCAWSKNLDALPYKAAKEVFQSIKKMYHSLPVCKTFQWPTFSNRLPTLLVMVHLASRSWVLPIRQSY